MRPTEIKKWSSALENIIESSSASVIGHLAPEESFDLSEIELEELANLPLKNDRIIELNAKYRRPPLRWLGHFKRKQVQFHLGSDAHSLADVGNFESIRNLITFVKQDQF